jgi:hypothetical protein
MDKSTSKKKFALIAVFFSAALLLSACGKQKAADVDMNVLSDKGTYEYKNADLGFSFVLPEEFIYYQTQRKNGSDYTDLEIFVPSGDAAAAQEVPGYGKPVVVRVYDKDAYDKIGKNIIFKKVGEKNGKVYTIRFWDQAPSDWKDKWTDSMAEKIEKSLKAE